MQLPRDCLVSDLGGGKHTECIWGKLADVRGTHLATKFRWTTRSPSLASAETGRTLSTLGESDAFTPLWQFNAVSVSSLDDLLPSGAQSWGGCFKYEVGVLSLGSLKWVIRTKLSAADRRRKSFPPESVISGVAFTRQRALTGAHEFMEES